MPCGTRSVRLPVVHRNPLRRSWTRRRSRPQATYPSILKESTIDRGAAHGIDVQVVTKDPQQRGFKPQRKRWAVKRTFGWLMLHRRLVRDYETLPQRSRAMIHWAMIDNMSRRLTGESTPSWRDDHPANTDTL
jgi:transposase